MRIGNYNFINNTKPFILAECCNNFQDSLPIALKMIEFAANCGADGVKFQHRRRLTLDQLIELKVAAEVNGLQFVCTAYDHEGIGDVATLTNAFKIGSAEVASQNFCKAVIIAAQSFHKMVIVSTGGMTWVDVKRVAAQALDHGVPIVLLQCTSIYPTPPQFTNLNVLRNYEIIAPYSGYSDHTGRVEYPIAALTLGAQLVEVHFTLDKNLPGPDQIVSHTPEALLTITNFATAIGGGGVLSSVKNFYQEEKDKLDKFRGKV